MFHEIWTFWPLLTRTFPLQWFHRRAIRRLLESSDAVFTSTPSQGDHLRILAGAIPIRVLPVGSNVRPNEGVKISRSQGWAVLLEDKPPAWALCGTWRKVSPLLRVGPDKKNNLDRSRLRSRRA